MTVAMETDAHLPTARNKFRKSNTSRLDIKSPSVDRFIASKCVCTELDVSLLTLSENHSKPTHKFWLRM